MKEFQIKLELNKNNRAELGNMQIEEKWILCTFKSTSREYELKKRRD